MQYSLLPIEIKLNIISYALDQPRNIGKFMAISSDFKAVTQEALKNLGQRYEEVPCLKTYIPVAKYILDDKYCLVQTVFRGLSEICKKLGIELPNTFTSELEQKFKEIKNCIKAKEADRRTNFIHEHNFFFAETSDEEEYLYARAW